MSKSNRPMSPHLQVYRWEWSMSYSILHRMTGVALGVGSLILAVWLISLAISPKIFLQLHGLLTQSWIGIVVMTGCLWSLCYHLLNGIRHLFWDIGKGFDIGVARMTGHLVGVTSIGLTAAIVLLILA